MRIAILDDYQNVALELADWESLDADVHVFTEHIAHQDELVRRLAGFDVVVAMRERTPFPDSVLSRLPELRLLVTTGQRNASIDVEAARRHGILVCGTGYLPHPTVELTWALILAACRHLPTELRAMRDGGWQSTLGTGLRGRTLGVLGLGRLGAQVARVGQAFGMRTIAWSHNLTPERAAEHDVTAVTKDELLASSDVLTVHLVLSERTRGLVGAAELAAMKPTALLVNTSRGPIVDTEALVHALRDGVIGGAALDVYDEEPLSADHSLRSLPNAVLTPHIGFVTRETYEVFYRDAVADIAAFQRGEPVRVLER
ncbi:D-2-hydroxyacid dehydrogenase family protein [Saccharomonospora cyanea]|uniref:Lactate dehydrogenase-like oxidoreductase n=1 Tax=Saccharomonospora cyanea NA-134 TaxID=882082 RepID=H5XJM2_9PSEU|nr:D-2-hydroxyacid dehydrogenase family protein [Saccharomonospora cyanea]EHR60788.1 lactate dehydrogenase-like oxidoreductase [Saccharomonospora cyanea NA-134]